MKACFISHSSAKGGAERSLLELVDVLKERGIKCYVMLPGHGSLINELETREVAYRVLSYGGWVGSKDSQIWKRIVRNLIAMIPLIIRLKQWRCDVVFTNTITVCVGALAAKLLGLPHIWYIREFFGYEDHDLVFDFGEKPSLWLMDRLSIICIANSQAVAQKYQQWIKSAKLKVVYQSVIVPQNISTEKVIVEANTGTRCVIVGTLQEQKGQEDAILAISEIVHMGIKAELVIVGDGGPRYKEYLHDLVTENKLDKYVRFAGYVENPFPSIKSADVVLMCSRSEGFGRVTIEAMKIGKPVIGTRSGGTMELIQDGFNGLLYTTGDYKELAGKIKYLYEHPDIRQRMGRDGQKWATERFTKDHYGKEVLDILKQIVKKG